jgi:hypothetical protein
MLQSALASGDASARADGDESALADGDESARADGNNLALASGNACDMRISKFQIGRYYLATYGLFATIRGV